jgi:tetratricopeptide (TPR) repeat protein/tRNA A-37 threonylcarbamoyl transferase component Bud32
MSDSGRNVKAIFGEALACATPAEQAAYLDGACGDDTALRARVEALLRAHQRAGNLLQGPPAPADGSPPDGPGMVLGPYQLQELIGEGGFGMVYRAEQRHPVRRRVALKVLRPGMDGRHVVARFEAERQALALMNHPHIAGVLDAGEAPPAYAGGPPRPYFVMELVEGVPLTDFCDQERLTPRERLGLFIDVCQAVQHAHQKGIIHRDLKPSNVLVTRQDGEAVVKVIDFGVAKALEQRLTDKTLVTGVAQVIGTPLYMSPEQAEPGAVDIDTRSDIYSLGVLLYELLTGTTPFDRERLREASFDELRRIIREEEPPRPSTRVSTLGPAAVTLSEQRRTDPRQLGQLLRGELDWIVMKCLEKDRGRRYETADALARDVARYLADEPVEACPPAAGYRLGKFLRKHRRPLATAAGFLVLLAAAGVLAGMHVVREARADRDRAVEQARREGDIREALDRARALRDEAWKVWDPSTWARARGQAQRALTLLESGPADEALAAQVRQVQEELDEEEADRRLVADLEAAWLAEGDYVAAQSRFAFERAIPRYRDAFRAYGLLVGEGDPAAAVERLRRRPPGVRLAVSAALDEWLFWASDSKLGVHELHLDWLRVLAGADLDGGEMRELRAAEREPDAARRRAALERLAAAADVRRLPARALVQLARQLSMAQANPSAMEVLRRAWRQYPADFWVNEFLGSLLMQTQPQRWPEALRHLTAGVALRPDSAGAHLSLGAAFAAGEQWDEAIACYHQALELAPEFARAHYNLGVAFQRMRRPDQAIASYHRALELDPKMTDAHVNLGISLNGQGRLDEAIACYRRALELDSKRADAHANLGISLNGQGHLDEAIACYRRALELDSKDAGSQFNLGKTLMDQGRLDEAIACYRRALELDPKLVRAHSNLGAALQSQGHLDEAIVCYHRALAIDPKSAPAHANLGAALDRQGHVDEAIACYRRALELDPKDAGPHCNLGKALLDQGRLDEAIACYRQALAIDPKLARAHHNLGKALLDQGRFDEAIACCHRALELDPRYPAAHNNLGTALWNKGRLDEAIACYRRAIELDPQFVDAHCNLGLTLAAKGRLDEAIACYRRTIQLNPRYVAAHYNLGNALQTKGQVDETIACFRRTLELSPQHAEAHCNLAAALLNKGDFRAALASIRTGHALGTRRKNWPYNSAEWVKLYERYVQLDHLLTATRLGKAKPAGPAECVELADFCREQKQSPAAALRFYTEAFTAQPKLAADLQVGHRYHAAQAAASAGCGQGQDGAGLDAPERARLRGQALEWLRADLTLCTTELKTANSQARQAFATRMKEWLSEPSLAGVRDAAGLAALPADERSRWQALWADVAAARNTSASPSHPTRSPS